MAAQDNLSPKQFKTMSVHAVGKLASGDYGGTMGELAEDDYARWQLDQSSRKYRDDSNAFGQLSDSIAEHGVQKPLEISARRGSAPEVSDGHHRYAAAYDTGQSRVPVRGAVKAAKAFAHYTPPDTGGW